ncbi:UDP-N-acetylmuramoyl-L-alanine--D-glutamate ligase [Desertibaculum subflavum]|uniref:UDP-N-acetylmuramoyl-L-alanine--D-glutamate ligase n=1 Tax=Desertibaculum subflavum TaxID=2268458 RepID=UPI000E6667AE
MIPITAFRGREVAVVGLARSGLAAARALEAGGAKVAAWDDSAARRNSVGLAPIDPMTADWQRLAAVVLSPGIPLTHPAPHPVVQRAAAAHVEVIGDIELLLREALGAALVGVTGTNGKSTTTALIGHVLAAAGRRVQVGGNIGAPVLDLDPLDAGGIYVVELSSFQIDLTPSLACDVAILLNITPDHLDRHGDMAGYVAVKRRIFDRVKGTAVIGVDDDWGRKIAAELDAAGRSRVVPISVERPLDRGISILDGKVAIDGRPVAAIDLKQAPALIGRHNHQNAAAAIAAALALGLDEAAIAHGLATFPGLAHRLERIATVNGVDYINDSKATNADAAAKALAAFDRIFWIAGGKPKAGGIEPLADLFPHVAHAFLIGEAAAEFTATLQGRVEHEVSGSLDRAVAAARVAAEQAARAGAKPVVLLSPACASYDQFADFEARGEAFRALVHRIAGRAA